MNALMFIGKSLCGKSLMLNAEGKIVKKVIVDKYHLVSLYFLKGLFVEVYCSVVDEEIQQIKVISEQQALEQYILSSDIIDFF